MHLYANSLITYDDDRSRTTDYPLRTELMMEVFNKLCQYTNQLSGCIDPRSRNFYPNDMKCYADRMNVLFEMLNNIEKLFLDWMLSVGQFDHNKEGKVNSVLNVSSLIAGRSNLKVCIKNLLTYSKCFSKDITNNLYVRDMYGHTIYDECETTGSFTDPDEMYNVEYRQFMEYTFQEFMACYNVYINAKNRENLKNYRTCEKCGTIFQRSKSRNMHYPKCNGVNKGYYIGKTNEKTSDW